MSSGGFERRKIREGIIHNCKLFWSCSKWGQRRGRSAGSSAMRRSGRVGVVIPPLMLDNFNWKKGREMVTSEVAVAMGCLRKSFVIGNDILFGNSVCLCCRTVG